jgi:hypothetical protein
MYTKKTTCISLLSIYVHYNVLVHGAQHEPRQGPEEGGFLLQEQRFKL